MLMIQKKKGKMYRFHWKKAVAFRFLWVKVISRTRTQKFQGLKDRLNSTNFIINAHYILANIEPLKYQNPMHGNNYSCFIETKTEKKNCLAL